MSHPPPPPGRYHFPRGWDSISVEWRPAYLQERRKPRALCLRLPCCPSYFIIESPVHTPRWGRWASKKWQRPLWWMEWQVNPVVLLLCHVVNTHSVSGSSCRSQSLILTTACRQWLPSRSGRWGNWGPHSLQGHSGDRVRNWTTLVHSQVHAFSTMGYHRSSLWSVGFVRGK